MIDQWNIDLLIGVIVAVVIVRIMMWLIKPLMIPALLLVCIVLIFNQWNDKRGYTFSSIATGYKVMVTQNWQVREQKQTDQVSFNPHLLKTYRSGLQDKCWKKYSTKIRS